MIRSRTFSLLAAALAITGAAHAAEPRFGIGVDYSSGDYGSDVTTEILSIPVTAQLDTGNWSLRASLPWVRVSGDANVLPGVGLVDNLNPTGRGRGGLLGGPPGGGTGSGDTLQRGEASGVGDLALRATYAVPTGTALGLDLGVNAKIATADEDKGLGTGANDYGVSVDLYRDFSGTLLFGGVGYTWLGDSAYIETDSAANANLGIARTVGNGRLGVMLDHRDATSHSFDDRRELIGFYNLHTGSGPRLQLYASHGLTDGSPDWGAGLAVSTAF
ncbi:MAG TPA: transporter [Lysobacter sp.]|nr:transporter [Lysobacter sp.]